MAACADGLLVVWTQDTGRSADPKVAKDRKVEGDRRECERI